jgi:hypothetical protein
MVTNPGERRVYPTQSPRGIRSRLLAIFRLDASPAPITSDPTKIRGPAGGAVSTRPNAGSIWPAEARETVSVDTEQTGLASGNHRLTH